MDHAVLAVLMADSWHLIAQANRRHMAKAVGDVCQRCGHRLGPGELGWAFASELKVTPVWRRIDDWEWEVMCDRCAHPDLGLG